MTGGRVRRFSPMHERRLSITVFVLFSSWLLALPFEGRLLSEIAGKHALDTGGLVIGAVAATAAGLLFWGFLIRSKKTARRLILCSTAICMILSAVFFAPPSALWNAALVTGSFFIAASITGWGYYFKSSAPKYERIKVAATGLIFSNILMIGLNVAAVHFSPYLGLALAMFFLGGSFLFALRLPPEDPPSSIPASTQPGTVPPDVAKPLALLCLFVLVITINSGLMYHVLNPSFSHLSSLASWYWALPYIAGLYLMLKFSRKIGRGYILYTAIAAIGLSFIAFMILDRSAFSYLVVNTLMLGACGACDLFWWSILGEMLDLSANPAKILGIGLSANVAGVFIGGVVGDLLIAAGLPDQSTTAIALAVVCATLVILPPLYRYLSVLLDDRAFYAALAEISPPAKGKQVSERLARLGGLSEREKEVAALLLHGKTYRRIAGELSISENTVKTHVKNIYAKCDIQSRGELIDLAFRENRHTP